MTEPFHDRTAEIIAAYGADTARWPDAERATARRLVTSSRELSAALADAARLDADLVAWARTPVAGGDADAAAARAVARTRPYLRWSGTGIAAALAGGLLLFAPAKRLTPSTAPVVVAAATPSAADTTAFSQVFTPTPDEEQTL